MRALVFSLASVALLSACDYAGRVGAVDVPAPGETPARSAVSGTVPAPLRALDVDMGNLLANGSGQMQLAAMPLCDASAMVMESLAIPSTCAGGGTLAIHHPSGDAASLLALFIGSVERLGGSVVISEDGAARIVGPMEGGASAAGIAGPVPSALDGAEPIDGLDAFTVDDVAGFQEATELVGYSRHGLVRPIRGPLDADNAQALADGMGLDLRVISAGSSRFVVGSEAAVATWDAVASTAQAAVVPVPASGVPAAALDAYRASYPAVTFSMDDASGTLYLGGAPEELAQVVGGLSTVAPAVSRVRVDGLFFSYSTDDLRTFEASLRLGVESGEPGGNWVGVTNGAPLNVPFEFVVENLERASFAQIVARPSVTATMGLPATFRSGGEVPLVSSYDPETGAQEVTYREVGLSTRFTAVPLLGNLVRLTLDIEMTTQAGTGVVENPVFETRSVSTTVDLHRGDTVLLSGLAELQRSRSRSRSFGLPGSAGSSGDKSLGLFVTLR